MKLLQSNSAFALVCFAACCINIIGYYPGFSSPDTYDQYQQALHHVYQDWHPPLMAYVWHILLHLHHGIFPMLVAQLLLLYASCFCIGSTFKSATSKLLCVLCFLLLPFVQNFAGYIIKDVQMAYAWLLSIAIMYWLVFKHHKSYGLYAAIALLLITYGAWLRYNAVFALLPLCFIWMKVFSPLQNFWKLLLSASLLLLVIIKTEKLFKVAIGATKQYPEQVLLMHDLSGIFVTTSKNVFPQSFYQDANFDTAYIRANYRLSSYDNIWWNADHKSIVPQNITNATYQLKQAWLNAIINHPAAYLQNRCIGYLYFLRWYKRNDIFINFYFSQFPNANSYGNSSNSNIIKMGSYMAGFVMAQKNAYYMQPWFWLLLNVVLFAFLHYIKNPFKKQLALALLFSSLIYAFSQLVLFTTDSDFRYFYWNCLAISFSLFLILASVVENKQLKNNQ